MSARWTSEALITLLSKKLLKCRIGRGMLWRSAVNILISWLFDTEKGSLTQTWHFGRSRSIERSPKIFLNSDGDVARCVEIQTVCECRWIAIQYDCNLMNCYTISTEPHWSRPKMRSNHSAYFCSLIHGKDVFWIAVIPIDRRTVALHFMENVKTMIIYE